MDEEDAARKEKEAIDQMLRNEPPSPRKTGERTIAQGGKPKKLRYFAKFDRTPAPPSRRPRGTGKKHPADIECV